jgi:ferritin-like metal-binding protein YciE
LGELTSVAVKEFALQMPLPLVLTDPVESLLPSDRPVFPPPMAGGLVPLTEPFEPPDLRQRPPRRLFSRNKDFGISFTRWYQPLPGSAPMGFFTKDIKTMDELFVHTLRDIYYAENQIVKALPDMVEKATDPGLKQAFQAHLGETRNHVARVEQVFKMHGVEAEGVDCPAIDGIIDEANDVAGEVDDKKVLDAALIAAAQAVEHYEMTRYGTLVAWAKQLGRNDCASVLQQNLDEEKAADQKLNALAEGNVNRKAA